MQKEMFTEENLRMIWLMATENTHISMGLSIKENSKTMCKKDTEKKNGLMEPSMLEHIKME